MFVCLFWSETFARPLLRSGAVCGPLRRSDSVRGRIYDQRAKCGKKRPQTVCGASIASSAEVGARTRLTQSNALYHCRPLQTSADCPTLSGSTSETILSMSLDWAPQLGQLAASAGPARINSQPERERPSSPFGGAREHWPLIRRGGRLSALLLSCPTGPDSAP